MPPDLPAERPLPGKAARVLVSGRVQGVGFRYSAVREARRLGIHGTVENRADGTVEVVAEGSPEKLERFIVWLRKGPPGAWVREARVEWIPYSGRFQDFDVQF
jgi:acylphosphatase